MRMESTRRPANHEAATHDTGEAEVGGPEAGADRVAMLAAIAADMAKPFGSGRYRRTEPEEARRKGLSTASRRSAAGGGKSKKRKVQSKQEVVDAVEQAAACSAGRAGPGDGGDQDEDKDEDGARQRAARPKRTPCQPSAQLAPPPNGMPGQAPYGHRAGDGLDAARNDGWTPLWAQWQTPSQAGHEARRSLVSQYAYAQHQEPQLRPPFSVANRGTAPHSLPFAYSSVLDAQSLMPHQWGGVPSSAQGLGEVRRGVFQPSGAPTAVNAATPKLLPMAAYGTRADGPAPAPAAARPPSSWSLQDAASPSLARVASNPGLGSRSHFWAPSSPSPAFYYARRPSPLDHPISTVSTMTTAAPPPRPPAPASAAGPTPVSGQSGASGGPFAPGHRPEALALFPRNALATRATATATASSPGAAPGCCATTEQVGRENTAPMSLFLRSRVAREPAGFVDDLGFGTWTVRLDPDDPEERALMEELLDRIYNRPEEGFFINEIFGRRSGSHALSCSNYFQQLMVLARHKVLAFATVKSGQQNQFDVTYDTPEVYNTIQDYFRLERRAILRLNGTGGGRKRSKGAPRDFIDGMHYFKSRRRAVQVLLDRERHPASSAPLSASPSAPSGNGGAPKQTQSMAPVSQIVHPVVRRGCIESPGAPETGYGYGHQGDGGPLSMQPPLFGRSVPAHHQHQHQYQEQQQQQQQQHPDYHQFHYHYHRQFQFPFAPPQFSHPSSARM